MSLQKITNNLNRFILSSGPGILLLRGKWGVGKTYLWNEGLKALSEDINYPICQLSLFGLSSIHEVKFALAAKLIFEGGTWRPRIEQLRTNSAWYGKLFTQSVSALTWTYKKSGPVGRFIQWGYVKIVSLLRFSTVKLGGGLEALLPEVSKAIALSAFDGVGKAIICFDDLERKEPSLTLNELFGLATLLRDKKQCKVVFILNDDMLQEDDKIALQRYKEKVVDVDILLEPTPDESIAIAVPKLVKTENEILKERIKKLGINNIRIIRKILKNWLELKEHFPTEHFHSDTINSAASTFVLFSWAYYGTAHDKPSAAFLIDYKVWDEKKNPDEQVQRWTKLLEDYGYTSTDELDLEIEAFVRTGYVNDGLSEKAVELNQKPKMKALEADFSKSWRKYHDSFAADTQEVVDTIFESFIRNAKGISPGNLNGAVKLFKELGDSVRAQQMIDYYISERGSELVMFDVNARSLMFFEPPEPEVAEAFDKKKLQLVESETSSLESIAAELIQTETSLSYFKEQHLVKTTVNEFFDYFKSLESGADAIVRAFMRFASYNDERKIIAVNAARALRLLAGESELQRRRVHSKLGRNGASELIEAYEAEQARNNPSA